MTKEELIELNEKFIKRFNGIGVSKGIVKEYMDLGADANYRQSSTGFTPLIAAAYGWRLQGCVKALLEEYHVDVNSKDNNGETAFTHAIGRGNWGSAFHLFKNSADINERGNKIKIPSIPPATIYILGGAQLRNLEYVKEGVEMGGNIDSKEKFHDGDTALIIAVKSGLFDMAKYCLEQKASIEYLRQSDITTNTAAEKKKMKELLTKYLVPLK